MVAAPYIDAPAYGPHGAVTLLYRCVVVDGELRPSHESVRVAYRDPETVDSWFGDHASYVERAVGR
nr:hypothetical protein [Halomarina oriensis]